MKPPKPEWTFPLTVTDIGNAPAHYKITADADACDALADRYDVVAVHAVSAHLVVTRERGGSVFHVTGTVSGDIVQECVVTLDPITTHVTDEIDAYFTDRKDVVPLARARAQRAARQGGEIEVELIDESAEPELVIGGVIDLGEVAAQFLSLAIDPYPRRASLVDALPILGVTPGPALAFGTDVDAVVEDGDGGAFDPSDHQSPFAALKQWKDNLGK